MTDDRVHACYNPTGASRREALQFAGLIAALAPIPAVAAKPRRELGIVEITLKRELATDYSGTLRRLRRLGYTHFSFAMSPGTGREPASRDKAAMVRDAGLEVGMARLGNFSSTHERDIEDAAAIGAKSIVMSASPVFTTGSTLGVANRTEFDRWVPQFASLASRCREARLTLCYHNHWWDLQPFPDGETPLDILIRAFRPRELAFEIDLGWCWYAGVSPLDLIGRLGPRVVAMHLKDIDRSLAAPIAPGASRAEQSFFTGSQTVVIGQGEVGYAALLPKLRRLTSALGYIEVDRPADGLAAADAGAKFYLGHS